MTALPLPGGRDLAAWWRTVPGPPPHRLWFADLSLHRVEALVLAARAAPPDPLARGTLAALARGGPAGLAALHLAPALLDRLLGELAAAGYARATDGCWQPTEAGLRGLERGEWLRTEPVRRAFHFVNGAPAGAPPHFLRLDPPAAASVPAPAGWHFDPALLREAIARPGAWKARHHFPTDVVGLVPPDPHDWRAVVLDRPERARLVLAEGAGGVSGYALDAGNALRSPRPVLLLAEDWLAVFPELGADPPAEAWPRAWLDWARRHALPAAVAAAAELTVAEGRLLARCPVRVPVPAADDAWLLVGEGRLRQVARVSVVAG